jgi:hypothetical protein
MPDWSSFRPTVGCSVPLDAAVDEAASARLWPTA